MEHAAARNGAAHLLDVRRWALWSNDPDLIAFAVGMNVLAAIGVVAAGFMMPFQVSDLTVLSLLLLLGVIQVELGAQVERLRPRVIGAIHINLTSVWFLPGVLLLPPMLVAVLIAVLYWHLHIRDYSTKRIPAYRTALNVSISIVTCYVARAAAGTTGVVGIREASHAGWRGLAAVAIAIGTYFTVNMFLVIPAITHRRRSLQDLFGTRSDNLFEVATLCVGALVALVLATMPALAILIIPPLFLLHRAFLINQLEAAARRDHKTGVWNIAGWHRLAYHALAQAERRPDTTFGVLMVDLDLFKRINDTHGHLVGDIVLKAVADTITATVRARDAVGRFGGEEFIVLLPDTAPDNVRAIAERIRAAITRVRVPVTKPDRNLVIDGLSASIGIATYPDAGTAIERLLQGADTAMYRAKSNGRNQVATLTDPQRPPEKD